MTGRTLSRPISRRSALAAIAGMAGTAALPSRAAGYPERPVRIVVPFSSGGTTDLAARLLAKQLQDRTGTAFIVENKPGAGAVIGIDSVAKAKADGYTLLYGSDTLLLGPLTRSNIPFSLQDFVALARVRTSAVYLAVSSKLPVSNVRELVAYAKQRPGELKYATGGIATVLHIAGVQFTMRTATEIVHVPYKGVQPAINDVLGGHVDMAWAGVADIKTHQTAGALKVLAMTGDKRSVSMPAIPTMAESGYPGLVVVNWNGMFTPRGTPPDVVTWLTDNIAAVAESPEFVKAGAQLEIEPGEMLKGANFDAFVRDTYSRYAAVIKQANIKLSD